jgi:hypothetical protein
MHRNTAGHPDVHGDALQVSRFGRYKRLVLAGSVRGFRHEFMLEDAIECHAFAPLEALPCV